MKLNGLSFLLITLLASAAAAANVAVFPAQVTNLSEGEAAAIGEVFAQAYADAAAAEVIPPRASGKTSGDGTNLPQAARELGVREYVELLAVKLDERILVQAVRRQASGAPIYRAQLTGRSLDDLPQVAARVAQSLVLERSTDETIGIKTVTREEASRPNRTFTDKVWGLRTSIAQPFAAGQRFEPVATLGFDWRLESQSYFLELGFGMILPASDQAQSRGYGGLFAELGGSYYLSDANIAPYIGAGVLPRLIFSEGQESPVNFAPYAQVGMMFARESSSRLYADLRVAQNVTPIQLWRNESWIFGSEGERDEYYPTEVTLQFGIGW